MPKCPRAGTKLVRKDTGQVVTVVAVRPGGARARTCAAKDDYLGVPVVYVSSGHGAVSVPRASLAPVPVFERLPPMYVVPEQSERTEYPGVYPMPMAPGVNGLGDERLHPAGQTVYWVWMPTLYGINPVPYYDRAAALQHGQMSNAKVEEYVPGQRARTIWTPRGGLGYGVPSDDLDTLRLYGKCVKKCRRHAPQNLGPCIDQCQESGGPTGQFLCAPQSVADLAGTDDYHARNAQVWASHAVEEAEQGAGDALNKGQCNRALESLVRAERKTTMASTNATQSNNPRLKAKALASNTLVNALWREFQTKCIRRYPGDHPGSVLPFGGVGGDLHERIAAVLGWSVQDTQSFSMHSLRELVRPLDPRLAQEISDSIEGGHHILQRGFGDIYTLPDKE
jgi:hypothetical protein